MPRARRIYLPGVSSHVYVRAINRAEIFHVDEDYEELLELARRATVSNEVDVHAYAIMTTHYHLIATPRSASALPRAMKSIKASTSAITTERTTELARPGPADTTQSRSSIIGISGTASPTLNAIR